MGGFSVAGVEAGAGGSTGVVGVTGSIVEFSAENIIFSDKLLMLTKKLDGTKDL